MSNERPFTPNPAAPSESVATAERETDDQRQDRLEREAVQRFVADVLMTAEGLSQEDRLAAAKAVESQVGQWRQYDGKDITVQRLERTPSGIKVHFIIDDPDMGKMEMDDDIAFA